MRDRNAAEIDVLYEMGVTRLRRGTTLMLHRSFQEMGS